MKTASTKHLITSLFFAAVTAFAARAEQEVITKSFPVKAGGKLTVNADRGSIHITTSESDKVDVKIMRELKSASAAEAKEVFAQHKIEFTSTGNEVKIEAENPQRKLSFNNRFSSLQVDYTIAIPAKFDIVLKTAGGHIEVADLQGWAVVETSGGNLKLGAVTGSVKAHTSGGHITLGETGGDAEVYSSGGDLHLGEIWGNLVAHTSGGHITLERNRGTVKATTSGGNIRVIEAYDSVIAESGGGNIFAQLNSQPTAPCSLKTSGGNLNVELAPYLSFDLDARTSGGRVDSDFPGNSNKENTRLIAQINSGGLGVAVATSGGDISIRKRMPRLTPRRAAF
jgi:DUF4097 and DUF4098 domain-containing protein YvlB